ncbi:MAG: tetratricopeptide repeat protein [bacterium]|nr:tetratricopeptide repeat protein [bacterium]
MVQPVTTCLRRGALWAVFALVACPHAVWSAAPGNPPGHHQQVALLEQALADFDEGIALLTSDPDAGAKRLHAAVTGFETVVRHGPRNGRLYYNLGNAYLQLGRLGQAIANYRRAEALIPSDGQLQANLNYARQLRRSQIAPSGSETLVRTLFFWHYRVPLRVRYLGALVVYVLFWGMLLVRPLLRQVGLRLIVVLLGIGWVTLGVSSAVEWQLESSSTAGVIVADEVVVRKGNSAHYEPQFQQLLYEGVEFTLIEQRSDWLRIELPNGSTGWIRADQAEIV